MRLKNERNFYKRINEAAKDHDINLIDVRTELEYAGSHIPEAQNFPLEKIAKFKEDKSQSYYLICRSGNRSARHSLFLN